MPIFLNPFMKHDVSDFPDVYVPLEQAERHQSVDAVNDKRLGSATQGSGHEQETELGARPTVTYGTTSLEELREEIDLGMLRA